MYEYHAKLVRIVDGDGIVVDIDLGCGVWKRNEPLRLFGINAPEMNTEEGKRAREALSSLLASWPLVVRTIKDKQEKYGRLLAVVVIGELIVNDWLVEHGFAVKKDY